MPLSDIPRNVQILTAADVYSALRETRVYKDGKPVDVALNILIGDWKKWGDDVDIMEILEKMVMP